MLIYLFIFIYCFTAVVMRKGIAVHVDSALPITIIEAKTSKTKEEVLLVMIGHEKNEWRCKSVIAFSKEMARFV